MPTADTASPEAGTETPKDDELTRDTATPTPEAEPTKTQDGEENPAAQPESKAQGADEDGDDPLEEHDPINVLRKQLVGGEVPKPAAAPQAKADEPKPEAAKPEPEKPEAAKKTQADDEALRDLPQEDWSKLSHQGKRQVLTQRKEVKIARQRAAELEAKEKESRERAESIEGFVRKHGLDNDEYAFGVQVMGAVKRGDPAAIAHLEATLDDLYRVTGRQRPQAAPAPAPQAPTIEPYTGEIPEKYRDAIELAAISEEDARLLLAAKAAREKAKTPPAQPAAPAPQPAAPVVRREAAIDPVENAANESVLTYLEAQGVPRAQAADYLKKELLPLLPNKGAIAVGDRLRAVIGAHQKRVAAKSATAQPPKPAQQPVSGRAVGGGGASRVAATNQDPLASLRNQWVR